MPSYKLTYFKGKGRAEVCRLIFAAAGQQYEDQRVEGEGWLKLKPDSPFGQLPMLEFDGVKISQSNAIARLLAKRFGMAGKTDVEAARIDMMVDCTEDMTKPLLTAFFEKDETKKAELKKKFEEETLPKYMEGMEKLLKSNKGGDGYFVGEALTWGDIHYANGISWAAELDWTAYPKLKALKERVEANPGIAEWMKKRPVTQF